jgi:hypothetical protein
MRNWFHANRRCAVTRKRTFLNFVPILKWDSVTLELKVGALANMPFTPHYYGFTWESGWVATEYLKDTIVLETVKLQFPHYQKSNHYNDGRTYEEDLTSGGRFDALSKSLTRLQNIAIFRGITAGYKTTLN